MDAGKLQSQQSHVSPGVLADSLYLILTCIVIGQFRLYMIQAKLIYLQGLK